MIIIYYHCTFKAITVKQSGKHHLLEVVKDAINVCHTPLWHDGQYIFCYLKIVPGRNWQWKFLLCRSYKIHNIWSHFVVPLWSHHRHTNLLHKVLTINLWLLLDICGLAYLLLCKLLAVLNKTRYIQLYLSIQGYMNISLT